MEEADKPDRPDEDKPKPDGFARIRATGDTPLGMFTFYLVLTVLALGIVGYVVALLVPR
jgi:hypothetical protein